LKSSPVPIPGVLEPGENGKDKRHVFARKTSQRFICGTLQLASGMTLQRLQPPAAGNAYGLRPRRIKVETRRRAALPLERT